MLQSSKHISVPEPIGEREWVLDELQKDYGLSGFVVPTDAVIKLHISRLNLNSSPGYPMMRTCATNHDLIQNMGVEAIVDVVRARLNLMSVTPSAVLAGMSARELVDKGFRDPVRVLVKNEMHSSKKMNEGRMRIISSVSTFDQLVERCICDFQNKHEIARYEDIPSKPGMGSHDQGLVKTRQSLLALKDPVSTDVSGWDWSVQFWVLVWDAMFRARAAGVQYEGSLFEKMALVMAWSLFLTSDGCVFEQVVRGIMLSGRLNTSSTNSRSRVINSKLVHGKGNSTAIAMGDDCVESAKYWVPDQDEVIKKRYRDLGVTLKGVCHATNNENKVEFCSYEFDLSTGVCAPTSWSKMAATLYNKISCDDERNINLLLALNRDLRHSPHRVKCLEVAGLVAAHVKNQLDGGASKY